MSRVLLLAAACSACGIANLDDQRIAVAIGRYIEEGYGKFVDRESGEDGPTWYFKPWPGGRTTIDLYEVTAPGDIAEVERLAREALRATEGATSVTLRFYEKENWRYTSKGGRRDSEKLLREVTFDRED